MNRDALGTEAGPLVSVVLPTYNGLSYLHESVGSVLAQTYRHFELIVVDDGSTDGTADYLRAVVDPRVVVLTASRSGMPGAVRNLGLQRAAGTYIAFLDADDAWEPRKLEIQLEALRRHGHARWSYTRLTRVDEAGNRLSDEGIAPWRACAGRILPELLRIEAIVALPTVMAERSLIEQAGRFDESLRYTQDYDLWFRMAPLADALPVSVPLCRVRVHAASHTSADRLAVHLCWVRTYAKAAAATGDAEIRRLCRERRTHHTLTAAVVAARSGRTAAAARLLARLVVQDPFSPRIWRSLAARLLPRRLLQHLRKST